MKHMQLKNYYWHTWFFVFLFMLLTGLFISINTNKNRRNCMHISICKESKNRRFVTSKKTSRIVTFQIANSLNEFSHDLYAFETVNFPRVQIDNQTIKYSTKTIHTRTCGAIDKANHAKQISKMFLDHYSRFN